MGAPYTHEGFATAEDGTRLFWELSPATEAVRAAAPVVLVDGIGCDGFAWQYIAPALAANRRVLHWHYRGHGRSGPPADPARVDIPALARDMLTVLDAAAIERAVVVTHSMGAQVALEAYRSAPARIAGLALLCGSAGRVTETFHGTDLLAQALPALIESAQRNLGVARAIWARVPAPLAFRLGKLMGDLDAVSIRFDDFRRYWEHVSVMDPKVFLAMLRCAGEHSADDVLPSVRVPTVVVAAERDTFTPAARAAELAGGIPHAEHIVLPGASHAAPVEQPAPILAAIDRMIARSEAPTIPPPAPQLRSAST